MNPTTYTTFTFTISGLTADEHRWIFDRYRILCNKHGIHLGFEIAFDLDPGQYHDTNIATVIYLDPRGRTSARLFHDGAGTAEHVTELIQPFLKEFRPKDVVGFTYSTITMHFRIKDTDRDAYAGGAIYISANEVRSCDATAWLRIQQSERRCDEQTSH